MTRKLDQTQYELLKERKRLIFAVTDELQRALDKAGISRSELARRLDKTPGFITQTFSGKNLTLTTIADTCTALGFRVVPSIEPLGDAARHQGMREQARFQPRHLENTLGTGYRESWTASGDKRIRPVSKRNVAALTKPTGRYGSEDQVAV